MQDDKELEVSQDPSTNNDPEVQVEIIPEKTEVEEPKVEENPQFKGLLKRVDTLTRKRREAEEREQAKDVMIQRLQYALVERDKVARTAESSSVEVMEATLKNQVDMAKQAIQSAYDVGDKEAMVEAQEKLADAKARMILLADRKTEVEEPQRQQRQQAPAQPQRQQYNNKAVGWARSKAWWNVDRAATGAAYGIDQDLTEEGYDPASDDYYDELDKRMKEQFPKLYREDAEEPEEPRQRPRQVVSSQAPRQATSQQGLKVRLTQDEIRTAQRLGITPASYAAHKAKIQHDGNSAYAEID
jgi:hypothetical protein